MLISACITMGLIHIGIGVRQKRGTVNYMFAITAFSFAAFSALELAMMQARNTSQFLELQRWADFAGAAGALSLASFVWMFFAAGRKWLALLGSALVCLPLVFDLTPVPKLIFLEITGIRMVETFGGASFAIAEGTRNPWVAVYYLGVFTIALFVADASVTLWRRGARRRAGLVGGTITTFILTAGLQAALVDAGVLPTPYLVSLFYLIILAAMGLELSREVMQAAQLTAELRESELRLNLAVDAAQLGLWGWNIENDEIWTTAQCRSLLGITTTEPLDPGNFFSMVDAEDRAFMQQDIIELPGADTQFERECPLQLADGTIRWIAVEGRVERDRTGQPVEVRGVMLDVSRRKEAELAALQLSGQLINAQELERSRLAFELHDDLNQRLALLAVELEMFGNKPPAVGSAITGRMQAFSAQVKKLSSAVHRLAHELHPAKLEQLGLVPAVRGFCRELGAAHEFDIKFESRDVPRRLPEDIALCLYRVIQEGLQNVLKHSGAKAAEVELTANEKEVCLIVSDRGRGFDASRTIYRSSLGLISMRERVRLVHGRLSIQSRSGAGTRIEVQVPLAQPNQSTSP